LARDSYRLIERVRRRIDDQNDQNSLDGGRKQVSFGDSFVKVDSSRGADLSRRIPFLAACSLADAWRNSAAKVQKKIADGILVDCGTRSTQKRGNFHKGDWPQ